jgi:hypothetical protein
MQPPKETRPLFFKYQIFSKQWTYPLYVKEPISPEEQLDNFMKNWFNPLNGVYTAIAAIVGGLSIWRIRKR